MLKNNKKIVIFAFLAILIFISIILIYIFAIKPNSGNDNDSGSLKNTSNNDVSDHSYILKDYPIDKVPLFEGSIVSSMKFFVNEDSTNAYDDFFDAKQNYYNVVFKANKDKKLDIFNFYKSKMSSISQETSSDDTIEGFIDIYKVSISNYGYDDYYLQVHLPTEDYSKENRYYEDYPALVETADNWFEIESTYGLLNQKGGEIEYSQWFDVFTSWGSDDSLNKINPIKLYYDIYKDKYAQKQAFVADDATEKLVWQDGGYEIWAVFSTDHGRVYLTYRKPIE